MKFAHLINPVAKGDDHELSWQQPITFESMRIASEFTKHDVELLAAYYPEDLDIVPDYFTSTTKLEDSTSGKFDKERKLPYLRDIFSKFDEVDSDYCIYTNVDIGLYPYFYDFAGWVIDSGIDSMSITRITKENVFRSVDDLPIILSLLGNKHPGHDCFIFKRDLLPSFKLGNVCIGMPWVGMVPALNFIKFSKQFNFINNVVTTFHIGNEMEWNRMEYVDYRIHNANEAAKIYNMCKGIQKDHVICIEFVDKLKKELELCGSGNYSNLCRKITGEK